MIDKEKLRQKKAKYEAEVKQVEQLLWRLQGAILAIDELLAEPEPTAEPKAE